MYETLHGTEIDVHEYPDCNAALERNIILDWETADPHCPVTHVPLVRCALCGYTTGGAYRGVTAYEILETVGIDIEESTPGEQMTPEIIRKFSDTDQRITDHTTERTQESLIGTTACRRCGDPIVTARGTRLCAQCEIWGCRECYDGIYRVDNDTDTREQGDTTEVLARCTECGNETWEEQ